MSIFKDAIDKRADAAISSRPSVQSGWLISTKDVIDKDLENIYFYSLNGLSMNDGEALRNSYMKEDPMNRGVSIAVKDANGVSRDERVFINPKPSNQSMMGSSSGKTASPSTNKDVFVTGDVVFSGTNNQLPTLIGFQEQRTVISDRTHSTVGDVKDNAATIDHDIALGNIAPVTNSGAAGASVGAGMNSNDNLGPIPKDAVPLKGPIRSILPTMIDKSGKKIGMRDKTQRGPFGNSIRTGTFKITNTDLAQLAKGSWYDSSLVI